MSDSDDDNDFRVNAVRQTRAAPRPVIEVRPPRQGDLDQQRGADTSPPVPRRRRNRSTSSADTSTGPASPSTSYENDDARSASIDSPVPVRGVARPRVVPLPAIKSGAASYAASVKAFSASGMKSGSASGYHPPSVYSYTSARSAPDQHYQFMSHHDVLPPDDVDSSEKSSEFGMRYTPVECDANQFGSKYSLREILKERTITVFIVVTMYNEDVDELKRTLKGIMRNLDTFNEAYGQDAWQNICVCIVADGRHKSSKASLDYLEENKIFDSNMMHSALDKSPHIKLHLFESTLKMPGDFVNREEKPLQTIFALKEHNRGKLDSHHWFFNAFSAQLRPKYCFMVDVGTKPEATAILKLFDAMERDPMIGGCCGEITTRTTASINPFVAAQQFEYKLATILDKSMESVFGFISVLPGAFSAYRYEAIEGEPLNQYFKQISSDINSISPFKGNMYLAEDRILCFEVLAEKGHQWTLRYVKDSKAATDVPESLVDLIKQRRRWLNGSLFAMVYALANFPSFVNNSVHPRWRKAFVGLQFAFYGINIFLQWFLLATFYLMFEFAVQATLSNAGVAGSSTTGSSDDLASQIFRALFLTLTLVQCVAGLGNRPDELPMVYYFCAFGYGVFFMYVLGINANLLVHANLNGDFANLLAVIASICSVAVYFAAGVLHGQVFAVSVSILQYFFLLPTFLIGFPIYSYCNIHDISWGTKGLENSDLGESANRKQKEAQAEQIAKRKETLEAVDAKFRTFRSNMVIGWLASNALFYELISQMNVSKNGYLLATYLVFFGINMFKLFFCFIFVVQGWIEGCSRKRKPAAAVPAIRTNAKPHIAVINVDEPSAAPAAVADHPAEPADII